MNRYVRLLYANLLSDRIWLYRGAGDEAMICDVGRWSDRYTPDYQKRILDAWVVEALGCFGVENE